MIEAADASLLYLPPDSPEPKDRVSDFHPIENAFAKRKALLRKAAERTIEGLWTAIGGLLETFHARRMRQLLRCSRIRCNVSGVRSKRDGGGQREARSTPRFPTQARRAGRHHRAIGITPLGVSTAQVLPRRSIDSTRPTPGRLEPGPTSYRRLLRPSTRATPS